MNPLIETITSNDPDGRNRSFYSLCVGKNTDELLQWCEELEQFRKNTENLYERVRATLFLYASYRFFLQNSPEIDLTGVLPTEGYHDLLERRFEQAIKCFRNRAEEYGADGLILSALAEGYHHLSFKTLLNQVRKSVRAGRGNRWMFRLGHVEDHPVKIRKEMLDRTGGSLLYPVLTESTPVRLDLSHSGWSDIFFLGMDFPEGARVLNISVNLGVYGRDDEAKPPISTYLRVIPEPLLRLTAVDLEATKDIIDLSDLFNFGNDYLSLLKAGVIASGLIPSSFEGTGQSVSKILERIVGPGMGLELVTMVNDIPKGSRLAVSTNLLASIVSLIMRATGQTESLTGGLEEQERRLIASRAILGEWLGGSGGGWQDSGGVWPGFKVIEGTVAKEEDPEFGISKGCLLPCHHLLGKDELHPDIVSRLTGSLVLLHGGMAQNVGPILEMVTEKYLWRLQPEWDARLSMKGIFDDILDALKKGDIRKLAKCTSRNWEGPLKTIIPYVTNLFTESIIQKAKKSFGDDYWGFLMLGGMSGGGMAMFVNPERKKEFCDGILSIMQEEKNLLEDALPFAMDPLVYNFGINNHGTRAEINKGDEALLPSRYYALQVPEMVRSRAGDVSYLRRAELDHFTSRLTEPESSYSMLRTLVSNLFRVADPASQSERIKWDEEAERIKEENGFDRVQHEKIRDDMQSGRIGLARNRLPISTDIEDVSENDVDMVEGETGSAERGKKALKEGKVAVMSLAAGMGSRWTTGAGVVKAVNPFVNIQGKHRSFLEIHLAKTRKAALEHHFAFPHIVSTSFLTHDPIEKHLRLNDNYGYEGPLFLSPGRSIGQRFIPMVRDLTFLWEETPQETLDEQRQKVRDAIRGALMEWARNMGEGSDYTDNIPLQRFHPPGHWYEIPNLLLNGVMAKMLKESPGIETIMLHNIDTVGANLNEEMLGRHLESGNILTFEVIPRRITDRGGGLARVNGQLRLLEGLAQPREEDELKLSYYNSMTTWIQIDPLLEIFGLSRDDLSGNREKIAEAVRRMAARVPTYITIKDAKRRWGHGQEDVYPVAQFEKLWSDMTSLPDIPCGYLGVSRLRGQQIKDPAELDPWIMDGSRDYVELLCDFEDKMKGA